MDRQVTQPRRGGRQSILPEKRRPRPEASRLSVERTTSPLADRSQPTENCDHRLFPLLIPPLAIISPAVACGHLPRAPARCILLCSTLRRSPLLVLLSSALSPPAEPLNTVRRGGLAFLQPRRALRSLVAAESLRDSYILAYGWRMESMRRKRLVFVPRSMLKI